MLLSNFNLLATAPGGVARLRELILTLAVQGKLVPQDPSDEPTSVLLKKIRAEKDRLMAEGKIRRDKPLAEIADEEKPFEVPQGWEFSRLGNLIYSIRSGGTPSKQNPSFWDGEIPWASVKDLGMGKPITNTQDRITKAGLDAGSCLAEAGTILICTRMGLGKIGEALIDVAINQDLKAVALAPSINKQYFINFFKTLSIVGSGMTVAGIKQEELLGFIVPTPPQAEQSRIVTRVEELMRVCDALEAKGKLEAAQHAQLVSTLLGTLTGSDTPEALAQNWQRIATHFDLLLDRPQAVDALEQTILQLAVRGLLVPQDPSDEPASALLQKIRAEKDRLILEGKIKRDKPLLPVTEEDKKPFELPQGWEWARLANAVLKITDGEHLSPPKADQGMPLLTAKDVTENAVKFENTQFVSQANGLKYRERCDPSWGDVLICSRGTIGRCAAVETDQIFCLMGSVILLKTTQQIKYSYLLLHLRTDLAQAWMRGVSSATAVSALYLKDVARCLIPVPPSAEQSRIVTRVEELRRLCNDLRQRLSASQITQTHLAEALVESVAG